MPVVAAIEEVTGIPTRIEAVTNNAGVIEAQVAERVDIATYGASRTTWRRTSPRWAVAKDQRTPDPVRRGELGRGGRSRLRHRLDRGCRGQERLLHRPRLDDRLPDRGRGYHRGGHRPRGRHQPPLRRLTRCRGDADDGRRLRHRLRGGDFRDDDPARARPHRRGRHRDGWTSDPIPGTPIVVGDWLDEDLRDQIVEASPSTTPSPRSRPACVTSITVKHPTSGARSSPGRPPPCGAAREPSRSSRHGSRLRRDRHICQALNTDVCRSEG